MLSRARMLRIMSFRVKPDENKIDAAIGVIALRGRAIADLANRSVTRPAESCRHDLVRVRGQLRATFNSVIVKHSIPYSSSLPAPSVEPG